MNEELEIKWRRIAYDTAMNVIIGGVFLYFVFALLYFCYLYLNYVLIVFVLLLIVMLMDLTGYYVKRLLCKLGLGAFR